MSNTTDGMMPGFQFKLPDAARWTCPIRSWTLGEARNRLKAGLGVKQLPYGIDHRRVEAEDMDAYTRE